MVIIKQTYLTASELNVLEKKLIGKKIIIKKYIYIFNILKAS